MTSLSPRLPVRSIVADPIVVHRRGDRASRHRRVDELLAEVALPRPYAGEQTVQRNCCPFADRCWQAEDTRRAALPGIDGRRHGARCQLSLDDARRRPAC